MMLIGEQWAGLVSLIKACRLRVKVQPSGLRRTAGAISWG